MKVHDKRELQNIAANHSTDIDYKEFMKIDKKENKQTILFFDHFHNITIW